MIEFVVKIPTCIIIQSAKQRISLNKSQAMEVFNLISIKMIMEIHNPKSHLTLILKVKVMIMIQIIPIIYPIKKQTHIIKKIITIK